MENKWKNWTWSYLSQVNHFEEKALKKYILLVLVLIVGLLVGDFLNYLLDIKVTSSIGSEWGERVYRFYFFSFGIFVGLADFLGRKPQG
jgi:hypothetical protein